jgi:uncharacterized membrane protein YbhN (UPF0104 family)
VVLTAWALRRAEIDNRTVAARMIAFLVLLYSIYMVTLVLGGVEGGLIGAFSAFGVPVQGAIVAVLAYRAFSFWLPTLPGILAYVSLRATVRAWDDANLSQV